MDTSFLNLFRDIVRQVDGHKMSVDVRFEGESVVKKAVLIPLDQMSQLTKDVLQEILDSTVGKNRFETNE